jgi:MFS superfamily sulfate permease-like transporter
MTKPVLLKEFHNILHHKKARTWPDLVLYRFGAALVFFNAPYFKMRVLKRECDPPRQQMVHRDDSTINSIDSTGAAMLEALSEDLRARVIRLGFQPPNRGSHLAETLWSTDGTRRRCPLPHPQISRGCLRLRRLCRNIGSRSRAVVGCVGSLVRRSLSAALLVLDGFSRTNWRTALR